eukprot:COSAG02_NODE_64151_length_261_cov_0.641975_1_plen_41_part_01
MEFRWPPGNGLQSPSTPAHPSSHRAQPAEADVVCRSGSTGL